MNERGSKRPSVDLDVEGLEPIDDPARINGGSKAPKHKVRSLWGPDKGTPAPPAGAVFFIGGQEYVNASSPG